MELLLSSTPFAWLADWQWRDASTLWFVLAPLIVWLVSSTLKRRQINQYADSELLPWARADQATSLTANSMGEGATLKGLSAKNMPPLPDRFLRYLGHFLTQRLLHPSLWLSVAWVCLIVALAGPRTAIPSPKESSRAGVDILIAVDTSRSMMVQDVGSNRFLFSRALIESLLNRLESDDRVGLMVFAGKPHLVTPLTFDHALFKHYLSLIRPGMLPTSGSQLYPTLEFGVNHLQQTAGKSQILMVFTNGEPDEYQPQTLPKSLEKLPDTKVVLVGVGKTAASRIPDLTDPSGYLHASGLLVTSRLEAIALQKLASQVGGQYLASNREESFIDQLLKVVSLQAQKRSFESSKPIWQDHAMPFIWMALFALIWAFYPLGWRRGRAEQTVKSSLIIGLISLGLGIAFASISPKTYADSPMVTHQQLSKQKLAYQAFQVKDFDLSQQLFDELNNYTGWFGAGDAAYRAEDYESAVLYFRQAAVAGKTDNERARALYNLGNAYYKTNLLPQAIEAYEQALVYQPNNEKAKHNLALAKLRQKVERRGQQQNQEKGDGKGAGSQSNDSEGSFYGGQKPNNEPGKGVSGDSPDGEKQAQNFVLPKEEDRTDFSLKSGQTMRANDTANAILDQQQRIRKIERFEQKMQQVQDNQSQLLMRLFEREEGFQAKQEKPHDLPGVKPW